tara:strand:- start:412 stop:582 length:171 start_codon:yes stop_codon:yes gene_type:complete
MGLQAPRYLDHGFGSANRPCTQPTAWKNNRRPRRKNLLAALDLEFEEEKDWLQIVS